MNICYNCFKPCHFVCARCGDAEYCGRDCQAEHWKKTHRNFCRQRRTPAVCRKFSARSAVYLARPLKCRAQNNGTCGAPLTEVDFPVCMHADPSLRWGASRQLPLARTPMRLSDYELMGKLKLLGEGSLIFAKILLKFAKVRSAESRAASASKPTDVRPGRWR